MVAKQTRNHVATSFEDTRINSAANGGKMPLSFCPSERATHHSFFGAVVREINFTPLLGQFQPRVNGRAQRVITICTSPNKFNHFLEHQLLLPEAVCVSFSLLLKCALKLQTAYVRCAPRRSQDIFPRARRRTRRSRVKSKKFRNQHPISNHPSL